MTTRQQEQRADHTMCTPFHGSYAPADCTFLLMPMQGEFVSIEEKERRIQSGTAHYSEMIHREAAPSAQYLELFNQLTERYAGRMAREVQDVAAQIMAVAGPKEKPITLVSLARAGTPVGALIRRAIADVGEQPCDHYSISIIRDRGIDENALDYILDERCADTDGLFFIDAWTAKGVITGELRASVNAYAERRRLAGKTAPVARLAVLSDIGGTSDFAATCEDYAIPSGVLNATVSGLISRSILNERVPEDGFHGCVYYDELAPYDQSAAFLDRVSCHFTKNWEPNAPVDTESLSDQGMRMQSMIATIMDDWGVSDINHIKPGIAEATRVMLRRVPEALIVRSLEISDIDHLVLLAHEKNVPIHVVPEMPVHAVSLIKRMHAKKQVNA